MASLWPYRTGDVETMAVSLPESPLRKAVQLFQAGRRSEAASQCSILLRKQPKSYETLYLLGVIRSEDGNLDEATALFTRALAVKPRSELAPENWTGG